MGSLFIFDYCLGKGQGYFFSFSFQKTISIHFFRIVLRNVLELCQIVG